MINYAIFESATEHIQNKLSYLLNLNELTCRISQLADYNHKYNLGLTINSKFKPIYNELIDQTLQEEVTKILNKIRKSVLVEQEKRPLYNEIEELVQENEQLNNKIEDLNSQMEELSKYKHYFDLKKELRD